MTKHTKQINEHMKNIREDTAPFKPLETLEGWDEYAECVVKTWPSGLHAVFSHDLDAEGERKWLHMSVSRANQYPGWDELKRVVWTKGLFDPDKDVTMAMPRLEEQAVSYPYVLHFWQED